MKRGLEGVFDDYEDEPVCKYRPVQQTHRVGSFDSGLDRIIDIDPFNPFSLDTDYLKDCLLKQDIVAMDLKERQQREWQLRCVCSGRDDLVRTVVVSGAYTVFDLGRTIITAFGWESSEFKYQSGQGHFPKKASFCRPDGTPVGDRTVKALKQLKIAEVLSPVTQELVFKLHSEAKKPWDVLVSVEGVSLIRHRQPLPRCVGGKGMPEDNVAEKTWGAKLKKGVFDVDALNDDLAGDRQGPGLMLPSSTPQDKVEEMNKRMRRTPLFDAQGEPDVKFHGWSDFVLNSNVKRRREDGTTLGPYSPMEKLVGFKPDSQSLAAR
mmetsp:Transcript_65311/g.206315  ORF Transcript_65311/g.206315 Transcript_65311/m.206315 type:complete len:321 (+) Transcript_65311:120-1082(+)